MQNVRNLMKKNIFFEIGWRKIPSGNLLVADLLLARSITSSGNSVRKYKKNDDFSKVIFEPAQRLGK
ncbi:MAG: hypothetical protein R3Y43_02025 [Alphaproteobacteria bacterium]